MLEIHDPLLDDYKKKATRDGYGAGLLELGKTNPRLVVLDADLSGSTRTKLFADKYPERFFNFGVAEQNMVGHAAGLALAGWTPVASSFAIFVTGRAWEIVRNAIAYPNLNVKLAGSHAGITLGEDGASHQIIEDIGLMRSIPNMKVVVPADYWQAYHSIASALKTDGPVYIRLSRPNTPIFYKKTTTLEIGKANIIEQGEKYAFFGVGVMVYEAWKAAKVLEKEYGVKPWVVDMVSVKPLDVDTLLKVAKKVDKIFTFEEHNIQTGFGSAIIEEISEKYPLPVKRIGIDDRFGQSGTADELMDYYGLSTKHLVKTFLENK